MGEGRWLGLDLDMPDSPGLTAGPSSVSPPGLQVQLSWPAHPRPGSGVELQLGHAGVDLSLRSGRPHLATARLSHQLLPSLPLRAGGVNTQVAGAHGRCWTAGPRRSRGGRLVTARSLRVKTRVNTQILESSSAGEVSPSFDWRTARPRILTGAASWFVR